MSARVIGPVVAVAVVLLIALSAAGGDDRYSFTVPLVSGYGLEDNSPVRIGGIDRGTVRLEIGDDDAVRARVELDDGVGPVGRDARVTVVAANFLGQKRLQLDPGDAQRDPLPAGAELTDGSAGEPTDLDQVLGVFDQKTQVRARILINGLGEAVVGRQADIAKTLEELPTGLDDAAATLDQLSTDNATMRALIERSDRFIAAAAREHEDFGRMIDVLSGTADTVAAERTALAAAIRRAPATLRRLRAFTDRLETTARDLGPATREVTAAAPALRGTLTRLEPTRAAAEPALRSAKALAPRLTSLAREAGPVVRDGRAPAGALADLTQALPPIADTLDKSSANLIAVLENWSRAIQFRDGLGHVFRGEAGVAPDVLLSAVNRLTAGPRRKAKSRPARERPAPGRPTPPAVKDTAPRPKPGLPGLPALPLVDETLAAVDEIVGGLIGKPGRGSPPSGESAPSSGVGGVLDYLLEP